MIEVFFTRRQTRTRATMAGAVALPTLLLAELFGACNDGGGPGAGASGGGGGGAGAPANAGPPGDGGAWKLVVPGGDCKCADGSEFRFWRRDADSNKVVLYLAGGGACLSAETCAPEAGLYKTKIDSDDGPTNQAGVFELAGENNPFADYSMVYVPYCMGDVFLGNATTEYGPGSTVHHKGYVNATAAVDALAGAFPAATEVVVLGESAGSVAAPLFAGLVSDRLGGAKITVLADASGAFPDLPELNGRLAAAWGTGNAIPNWPENVGLTAEQWTSFPKLFVQSGRHAPRIVFARHDYAYDKHQAGWYPRLGLDAGDLLSHIDANERQIEQAGVSLLSYTAPGDGHTVLSDEEFYAESVNGERFVDWVRRLIVGEPVADVRCATCDD